MNILFLDDDDNRWLIFKGHFGNSNINLVRASTAKECISHLQSNDYKWDFIFLDHDLGGQVYVDTWNDNTGSEVARWIVENYSESEATVIVHSFNPDGAVNMTKLLSQSGFFPSVIRAPFFGTTFKFCLEQILEIYNNKNS